MRTLIIGGYCWLLCTTLLALWSQHGPLENFQKNAPSSTVPSIHSFVSDSTHVLSSLKSIHRSTLPSSRYEEEEAGLIIKRTFQRTYAHILPCRKDLQSSQCIQKTVDYFKPNKKNKEDSTDTLSNSTVPSIPWWFQTLLRDLPESNIFGGWHELRSSSPPLRFCSIEKVGSSEWRKVFCLLNKERNAGQYKEAEYDRLDYGMQIKLCKHNQAREDMMPLDAPRAVFVRDPLERLLSAYLNKCRGEFVRIEKHCEPVAIFSQPLPQPNETNKTFGPDLLLDIEENERQMFAAYLDVMPLKWNLHFIPQAFSCDLYRTPEKYDFFGMMGTDFMMELDRMASRYGAPLSDVLDVVFQYRNLTSIERKHVNVGVLKGHGTQAPTKVANFFTPESLRRALEYVSIDYVMLNISVPEWAKKMLREDVLAQPITSSM